MIRGDGIVKPDGLRHLAHGRPRAVDRDRTVARLAGVHGAWSTSRGGLLDYRTDVFAAGIVLYQLTVGKLPFEGKNPHEVLKRIAECRFLDPRQANPRIGNRLGRIILKAMAAEPADRYAAIGEMVLALEAYLEESGLPPDKIPAELARYFAAPASYEEALRTRLVDTLTRAGTAKLDTDDRSGALDVFDRVLTIEPANETVLAILDRLNRRARLKTGALVIAGIGVLAIGGYAIHGQVEARPASRSAEHHPRDRQRHRATSIASMSRTRPAATRCVAADRTRRSTRIKVAPPRDAACAMITVPYSAADAREVAVDASGCRDRARRRSSISGTRAVVVSTRQERATSPRLQGRVLRLPVTLVRPTRWRSRSRFDQTANVHLDPGAQERERPPASSLSITITPSCPTVAGRLGHGRRASLAVLGTNRRS